MATARDQIQRSLTIMGMLGAGDTADPDVAAQSLIAFQNMMDSWLIERLTVLTETRVTHPLVSGTASYTVGSGGVIDTPRPPWITRALYLDANNLERTLGGPLRRDQWEGLGLKSLAGTLPQLFFYDPTVPLATLYLWPVPTSFSGTLTLVLYTPTPLTSAGLTLSTALVLAPGYAAALDYNLGVTLATWFGRPIEPGLALLATQTKQALQRVNLVNDMQEQRLDRAFAPNRGGGGDSLLINFGISTE